MTQIFQQYFGLLYPIMVLVKPSSTTFQTLPAPVKRRLKALKKSQLESLKVEAAFYEEVHKLECKYAELYKPHFDFRAKVAKGKFKFLIPYT